jgi:hypothetical protein
MWSRSIAVDPTSAATTKAAPGARPTIAASASRQIAQVARWAGSSKIPLSSDPLPASVPDQTASSTKIAPSSRSGATARAVRARWSLMRESYADLLPAAFGEGTPVSAEKRPPSWI